jgi:hypothetical protein
MSETLSRYVKLMEDKENWLAALLEREPEGAEEGRKLYATAALLRVALNAPEAPESVQSAARAQGLARLAELRAGRPEGAPLPSSWLSRLGSRLQAAFNLFRRR